MESRKGTDFHARHRRKTLVMREFEKILTIGPEREWVELQGRKRSSDLKDIVSPFRKRGAAVQMSATALWKRQKGEETRSGEADYNGASVECL